MIDKIKSIICELSSYTGVQVIRVNQNGDIPEFPYATYNITSAYTKGTGREDISYHDTGDDLVQKRSNEVIFTLSVNAYADTEETAIESANAIRKWFLFYANEFMREINAVVVDVGGLENRSAFLVDAYEYKRGFDVRLRFTETDAYSVDYFDKVELYYDENLEV